MMVRRNVHLSVATFAVACVALFTCAGGASTPEVSASDEAASGVDAAVRYESRGVEGDLFVHERFVSKVVGERRVFVFLPSEYEMFDEQRYPVLYLLDGQNYFDSKLASGGEEWALDEILVRHPDGVPEMIVVGVSAGAHAVREFSPPGSMPEARGAEYVDFLTRELKPFIDTRYRTKPGPGSTAIVGQGQSAVLALYAAWTHGDTFAGAIALDFPDVDMQMLPWMHDAPASGRPWVWLEQTWSDRPRPSTTGITAALQRHSDTQVAVTSAEMHRSARILAALRAMPVR